MTITAKIRQYLMAGLLVWVPIIVTVWVVKFFINLLDSSLKLIPKAYRPVTLLGVHLPGIGVILCVVVLFFTGMLVTNFLGDRLMKFWDGLIAKIPLVRTVYAGVKQIMETLLKSNSQAFRQVLLVEYPRKGMWSIAFQTSSSCAKVNEQTGEVMRSVFIPTTPNPTSGFLLFVPENAVYELDISIDTALKMVISLGVVQPLQSS